MQNWQTEENVLWEDGSRIKHHLAIDEVMQRNIMARNHTYVHVEGSLVAAMAQLAVALVS